MSEEDSQLSGSESESEQEIVINEPEKIVENTTELAPEKPVNCTPIKPKRKKTKKDYIKTSDPNIDLCVVKKKPGPKPKKVVYIYKDQLPDEEIEVVEKIRRPKGRPKKKIIKYVDNQNKEVNDRLDAKQVLIDLPDDKKELSAKDIKILELQERLIELEAVSGKKIRANRKGKPDGRQIAKRTDKQIAAAKALVERNRLLREQKKNAQMKKDTKESVKEVIGELAQVKQVERQKKVEIEQAVKKAYDPLQDPLFN